MLITYINDLAHKNSEALSFIPLPKLDYYIKAGQVLIEKENDDLCGYLIWGNGWPILRIYQACIQYDARQIKHGMNIVKRLIEIGIKGNCVAISLWCADDLEANIFWKSIGFQFAGQREGGKKRGRKHNRWVLPLNNLLR